MKKSILTLNLLLISVATHTSFTRYITQYSLNKDTHRYTRHHGATDLTQDKFTRELEAARNKGNKSPQSIATNHPVNSQRYIPGLAPKSPTNLDNNLKKNGCSKK